MRYLCLRISAYKEHLLGYVNIDSTNMGLPYQCNIDRQDCPTLYPDYGQTYRPFAFTNQSCVRDLRMEGNIGRCGFPGAPCVTDTVTRDSNCFGGGSYILFKGPVELRQPLVKAMHYASMAFVRGSWPSPFASSVS